MGILLKESRLIHTRRLHRPFLGSSKYIYEPSTGVVKKAKLRPRRERRIEYLMKELKIDKEQATIVFEKELAIERPKKSEERQSYRLNKNKVREKCAAFFGLKQSRKFLAFYTISFPEHLPDDVCMKVFNTFLTRCRQNKGLRSYLWVAERQLLRAENGTLHFHLLTNNYMWIRIVNYYMAKAIENQIKKMNLDVNFDVAKYNGVDVKNVNNNRKALNQYLTKYISKNEIVFYRLPYHSSRDISELFTAESFRSFRDADFSYILNQLQHVTTLIVDNEYASIEFLTVKQENGKYFNPPDCWYYFLHFWNEQIYDIHHKGLNYIIGHIEKNNYVPKWKKSFTKELLEYCIN